MNIQLRPYQESAIEAIMAAMKHDRYILLQAATGAGKTIIFCELIKRILKEYPMRIVILAHRRELIKQARDKLLHVWPGAPMGIACAGLSSHVNMSRPVVIGSIQTVGNRLRRSADVFPFHMIIIDEVHRLPPRNMESQYQTFLETMEDRFPELRVLGVTATPYRLGHGSIHGMECKAANQNWFSKLHFRIGIRDLQEEGYLCGIRAKEAVDIRDELKTLSTSNGEYNLGELSELMSREVHIGSAVKVYENYGENRQHVVVFCVTIEHARRVMEAFQKAGHSTGCIHSKMNPAGRDTVLSAFESGKIRILTNVGILTEGWDSPAVDCVLMCRPTRSPALYVQMIGRGTRIHPTKEDVLNFGFGVKHLRPW